MSAIAEWAVAAGTGALAFVTWRLARTAARQVDIERERIDAASRPLVYPVASYEWTQGAAGPSGYSSRRNEVLPLKNGGTGAALNVHGACYLPTLTESDRISLEIEGGTIAAGDTLDARVERPLTAGWAGVEGFIVYKDVIDDEWVTHFRLGQGRSNQLVCFHEPPGRVAELGDPRPRYASPDQAVLPSVLPPDEESRD